MLYAQTAYTSLVISEARIDEAHQAYVEITNVGNQTINLSEFEFGKVDPWTEKWNPSKNNYFMLPDKELAPGESFVMASVLDYTHEQWLKYPDQWNERVNKEDMEYLADMQIHRPESTPLAASDSVSPANGTITVWGGRDCWYLEHHFTADDSLIIDQVNGVFVGEIENERLHGGSNDVAGVTAASDRCVLIRKFSIKNGTEDFDTGRGQDIDESEWLPIPFVLGEWEPLRKSFWTVGNHGDYNLDATTLTSDLIGIDFGSRKLTVPWGVRNQDSLMMAFDYHPGFAWHYHLSPVSADSAFISVRTGDRLTVYACGNNLDSVTFSIELLPPTADENRVIPKSGKNADGFFWNDPGPTYRVTDGLAMDTILRVPFATRTDSLLKYLEKAPDASWVIVFNGGITRPDLKDGDILKVTSKNGAAKEYYIQVEDYLPSHNAYLSSITWPDIPAMYYDQFDWAGDTIPTFSPSKYNYKINLPAGVYTVPALVAKTQDLNAKITVSRATFLFGTIEDRTTTFTVTADDDTSVVVYKVQLVPRKDIMDAQPFTTGEPFISEFELRQAWSNTFIELCNPNGIPLDMSNYMVVRGGGDPYDIVDNYTLPEDSLRRYNRYVPGYKWQSAKEWGITPAILERDETGTNSIVQGNDVFVIGVPTAGHWKEGEVDFNFRNPPFAMEFQPGHDDWGTYKEDRTIVSGWYSHTWYLFKILNPDVKAGLVPANNPADFEIIDIFGMGNWTQWNIGGVPADQNRGYIRKPAFYKGKTIAAESFGTDDATSEWRMVNETYFSDQGYGWPTYQEMIADDIGTHFLNDITEHLSTVASRYYLVSSGYSLDESIDGLITGVTVEEFLADIVKAQEAQVLTVVSGTTPGLVLTGTDVLANNDSLVVVSANGNVKTRYALFVDATGLSDNAVITSTMYTIDHTGSTGTVGGFNYGALLSTVVANVTVPDGATLSIIDSEGAFVPMKIKNFDSLYVDVLATDDVYFEVVAQDGKTTITYQLIPNSLATDAFVLSYVYLVVEADKMIRLIPGGTTVSALLSNLIPAMGATVQVFDKAGFERTSGDIYEDDVVLVTAQDGVTTATYTFEMLEDLVYYMAYVTSKKYVVNSTLFTITGGKKLNDTLTVSEFLADMKPAPGATMTVLSSTGAAKSANDMLAEGDQLKVVSANGLNTVTYAMTVSVIIGVQDIQNRFINVYPNPSRGQVHVDGLNAGDRLQVYNMLGVQVMDKVIYNTEEIISISNDQKGIFFMVVKTRDAAIVGHFRLVIE